MNTDNLALLLIFGLPVTSILVAHLIKEWHSWSLKSRQLRLQELQAEMEHKRQTDEMNAQILRADDYGISPAEINQLATEIRQLREEVARIKQDVNGRLMG